MARYKVPQDVEADDKLLGPFSFRQFVYLLIAGGLIALAVGLFQIFPLLAIIPVPFVILLGALALPLKKDQPMETYLAALVSYVLKPRTRVWTPGQRNSVISVTAPKQIDEPKTRDLTSEEATHRLSFLAGIVDTKGYAIKGFDSNALRDDLIAESNATNDMFETGHFENLAEAINRDESERHEDILNGMKEEIKRIEYERGEGESMRNLQTMEADSDVLREDGVNYDSAVVVQPVVNDDVVENQTPGLGKKRETIMTKPRIIELANNADFSVATIAKEANRIKERDKGEVFISLH